MNAGARIEYVNCDGTCYGVCTGENERLVGGRGFVLGGAQAGDVLRAYVYAWDDGRWDWFYHKHLKEVK